jgi:sulfite oxidase
MHERRWHWVLQEKCPEITHVLQFPYNGSPPSEQLVSHPITSSRDFFVRNHGGIPEINADAWALDIAGLVNDPKCLTLADLQNETLLPRQSNIVTIQCSGIRRIEQIHEHPGNGDELINALWGEAALGTAL